MINENYMFDRDFLRQLDEYNLREVYAKVIALDLEENPTAELTGIVTAGTVNISGKSAVRRTCNLTLTTNMAQHKANLDWALRTKFKLYIGLKNFINPKYEDIIYFKMGTYVLTSYTNTFNTTGYTINIQGRDKMCLLSGDVSGTLMAETDFGSRWEVIPGSENKYKKYDIPIKTIIRDAIHEYAQEPLSNIIINDLNTCGVELLSYTARHNPIFVYKMDLGNSEAWNFSFSDSIPGSIFEANPDFYTNGQWSGDGRSMDYNGITYTVLKRADYGETVGFRATDLTYNGDLIAKVGESVTSILDKIVQMLGDFEYYYDIDGHFIFQRKKTYYNTTFTNAKVSTEDNGYTGVEYYYDSTVNTSAESYSFFGGNLIESYNNTPKLDAIKNDYSIWGTLKGIKDELPIHLRCAIDVKPTFYFSEFSYFLNKIENYNTLQYPERTQYERLKNEITNLRPRFWDENRTSGDGRSIDTIEYDGHTVDHFLYNANYVDWRELIYQMAKDAFDMRGLMEDITAYLNSSTNTVISNTSYESCTILLSTLQDLYEKNLKLGYTEYYTDILGFWRDLYRLSRKIVYDYNETTGEKTENPDKSMTQEEWLAWQANNYWNPNMFRDDYVYQVRRNDRIIPVPKNQSYTPQNGDVVVGVESNITVIDPTIVLFWFDFLDPESELSAYSIPHIGRRSKVINDNMVKSIFVRDTPNVLFVDPNAPRVEYEQDLHYVRMNIPTSYASYFSISSQGKSAKEVLDGVIYDSTYYQDTITLNAIPVYYLEPNTRVKVYDEKTGIDGDYIIDSLSYSMTHDGMMNLKASKAEERIL